MADQLQSNSREEYRRQKRLERRQARVMKSGHVRNEPSEAETLQSAEGTSDITSRHTRGRTEEADAAVQNQTGKRIRLRLIPIWLRLVMIVVLMLVSLLAGAVVGYGIIGSGKPFDALKIKTWQHISDLVHKE